LPWQRDGLVTLHAASESNPGNAVKDIETGQVIPISNEKNIIQFMPKIFLHRLSQLCAYK
jgi:hypothetical protein